MITKISLKNVASYRDETMLETNKRINLIYGLNGTGKTQISKFLANPQEEAFKDCEIKDLNDEKILVYNQDFINTNFYEQDKQKGIFTLSGENAEIKKEIDILQQKIKSLEEEKKKNNEELEKAIKTQKQDKLNFTNEIRKIREEYYNDFGEFFKGNVKSGEKFYNFIIGKSDELTNPNITIEEIRKQYKIVANKEQNKLQDINVLESYGNFIDIEDNPIFNEIIVGSQDSVIANLIKDLENEDWVKQGFDKYIRENSTTCPFCQQETLTQEFKNQLEKYFDKTYKEKIDTLNQLKNQYENLILNIPQMESFYRENILSQENLDFEKIYTKMSANVKENLRKIEEKIKEPSKRIELKNSKDLFDELNKYLANKQAEIKQFNALLDDRENEKNKLKEEFWKNIISNEKPNIDKYKQDRQEKQKEIDNLENVVIKEISDKISAEKDKVKEKQKSISNIAEAVENINKYLKDLGMLNFYIQIYNEEEQKYIIAREGENKPSFQTLSEGEKTLISFLYFLQLTQGREEENETISKKIIVIDDPISSLSFNYVFDIAMLIKEIFFKNIEQYEQIFILTHHLYFFHECLKNKDKDRIQAFKLSKNENYMSCIEKMENNEILNDYQAYWQILKDYKKGNIHKAIIPNTMRNILDYFFDFIYKDKNNAIKGLRNDNRYNAFNRYMNRESHFDAVNITDSKEIDVDIFFEAFKKVFENLGHIEHYQIMIGDNITNEYDTTN